MRSWRLRWLRRKGPIYVAVSPKGREGWPFAHKRLAEAVARHRSRPDADWTVSRYGNRR